MTAAVAATAGSRSRVAQPSRVVLACVGAAATAATVLAAAASPILRDPALTGAFRGLFVAAWLGVAIYTWGRRPESRLGPLLYAVGVAYTATSLVASGNPWVFSVGRMLVAAFFVLLVYVFVCYPRDRLATKLERRFLAVVGGAELVLWLALLAVAERLPSGGAFSDCGDECPVNPFQVASLPHAGQRALSLVAVGSGALALAGALILIVFKYSSPTRLRRRALEPFLLAMALLLLGYVAQMILREIGTDALPLTRALTAAGALGIPFAIVAAEARARLYAASSFGDLALRRGSSWRPVTLKEVEEFLVDALGDLTLRLYRWNEPSARYVDADGLDAAPPEATHDRAVTTVANGGPIAVVAHDPLLEDSADVVRGLTAAGMLLFENTRLVDDLRASRRRIIASGDAARLRLERNLHDGAQQRLLLLRIRLSELRRAAAASGDKSTAALADEAALHAVAGCAGAPHARARPLPADARRAGRRRRAAVDRRSTPVRTSRSSTPASAAVLPRSRPPSTSRRSRPCRTRSSTPGPPRGSASRSGAAPERPSSSSTTTEPASTSLRRPAVSG